MNQYKKAMEAQQEKPKMIPVEPKAAQGIKLPMPDLKNTFNWKPQ